MRRQFSESAILFLSVIKWVFLSTLVGVAVGLSTTGFLKLLNVSISFTSQNQYYYILLPVAFFVSSALVKYLAPDAEGHGTEKVIEAVHKNSGKIKASVIPVKLAATVITLAAGGSAGKEGPSAQIGAGISSLFADLLRFNDHDRKKLVICGISAGFASVFGTPIAGAIFGVEVLFIGSILYDVLLPSFIAGITAYQVSSALGLTYFYHTINYVPVFSESFFLKIILAGAFFGIVSIIFVESLKYFDKLSAKLKIYQPLKGFIGGALLVGLTLIFSKQFLGLGLETIEAQLQGGGSMWYDFPVKILFTCITLFFGGSGGIVTPIFFVGTSSGTLFAQLLGLDLGTFAGIGLVAVLAGSANTPIAASIMAVELFGPKIAPYATVACVISFLITGHRSVYPSQILSMKKSPSVEIDIGKEIEATELSAQTNVRKWKRKGQVMYTNLGKKIKKKKKNP